MKFAKASQLTRATFGLSYVLAVMGIIILAVTVGVGVKISVDLNRIAGLANEAHLETIPRAKSLQGLTEEGPHIELLGLKRPLVADESIVAKLCFEKAGRINIDAPVRAEQD